METTSTAPDEQTWRVIGPELADAQTLLAGGLRLLEGLADHPVPTLRWYRATRPALVLGRGQGDLDLDVAALNGGGANHESDGGIADAIPVVTRYSGGGAVMLDPSVLNLDVLVPAGHPWLDDADLGAVFSRAGAAWAEALRHLGLSDIEVYDGPATARRRGSPRQRLLAAVCYATLGRGEVLAGGRKIVGFSQRRRRQGALVQCGLLQRWSPAPLLRALGADPTDPEVANAAVGLEDLLTQAPDELAIRSTVEQAFRAAVAT